MEKKFGQEPAFPSTFDSEVCGVIRQFNKKGISKRFYAAIKLRVPDSGEEWLDEMIRKANRHDAACAAMQGLIANYPKERMVNDGYIAITDYSELIKEAYDFADQLLKQENIKADEKLL